jgi:probable phosphoglycerate mutase
MTATRIIAVRHGETDWNTEARIQGHTDIALNAKGVWQAQRVARALADEQIDCIYSSDLQRAYQTAQAIASQTSDLAPRRLLTHTGLRERGFGQFEGTRFEQIAAGWPEAAQRWKQRDPTFAPPQGETLHNFHQRIKRTLHQLAHQHLGEHILIVAHGGVMDVMYRMATGQEISSPRNWELGNAAINRLLWSPQSLTVVGWSDTRHLDEASLDETSS